MAQDTDGRIAVEWNGEKPADFLVWEATARGPMLSQMGPGTIAIERRGPDVYGLGGAWMWGTASDNAENLRNRTAVSAALLAKFGKRFLA